MTEIIRVQFGAGTGIEAGRGETRVDLGVAQGALVARGTDTLEPVAEGDTDTVMLAGN